MKTVFISNYINHHQIPFSDALYSHLGEDYHFIQTEPMEEKRRQMGWGLDAEEIPYVVFAYEDEERCRKLIMEADLVLAGWTERTDLFLPRMEAGKLTLRISERIYREGQIKALSPRGLIAKYREHVRFRNKPVYLLCAGAYVASDFSLIHAYPGKMFRFGYFPQLRTYKGEGLWEKKRAAGKADFGSPAAAKKAGGSGSVAAAASAGEGCSVTVVRKSGEGGSSACLQLVWAGRMIPLKHPEFVTRLAAELKAAGYRFHIHMIGSGPMEGQIRSGAENGGLAENFTFYGFLKPDEVRDVMEGCHIHLFTSNYLEGWGAVVNEAMNSGCCVVANAQAGAVPYLIEDGVNGLSYADGSYEDFARKVKGLFERPKDIERMGRAAYRTIAEEWNAEHAAKECLRFYENWKAGKTEPPPGGPFSAAKVLPARWKYDEGKLE